MGRGVITFVRGGWVGGRPSQRPEGSNLLTDSLGGGSALCPSKTFLKLSSNAPERLT